MNTVNRLLVGFVLLAALMPATAGQDDEKTGRYYPGAGAMIVDGLIYRPLSLAGTIIGTGLYIVTLPFSISGDNEEQARQRLIIEPANATFNRCLGCINEYHERNSRQ